MKRIFVINPTAGKRDAGSWLIPRIETASRQTGIPVEIIRTTHPGHARQIAAQAAAGTEEVRLYACGGDGTLNEVLQSAEVSHPCLVPEAVPSIEAAMSIALVSHMLDYPNFI